MTMDATGTADAAAVPGPEGKTSGTGKASKTGKTALLALGLVIAADALLYGVAPGLNLVILALVAMAVVIANRYGELPAKRVVIALGLGLAATLPLIEAPSVFGVLLAVTALGILALTTADLLPQRLTALPLALLRFAVIVPVPLVVDVAAALRRGLGLRVAQGVVIWTMPVALALVFTFLFRSANPVVADFLGKFNASLLTAMLDPWRITFWAIAAILAWPLLRPGLVLWRHRSGAPAVAPAVAPPAEKLIFGQGAILRSLIVFNLLFAVQTGLDLTYLWGGAALPDGMTHAEYAHRGAYPLIVTALLAAVFVLAAMRRDGPAQKSPLIRRLVYLWIGQNILLCISSILRLEQYVEVFSLSEWRIAAGIWMGLVAAGLALILLRILMQRSNEWLVAMNLGVLAATLYGCAFIDFSALIADFNVRHSAPLAGDGQPLDIGYLDRLGPSALPALDLYVASLGGRIYEGNNYDAVVARQRLAADFAARPADWRSWSFRDWRLTQYLAAHPARQ